MDNCRAPKLLIVEDDDDIRQALIELLNLLGYGVISSTNAHSAIEVLQQNDLNVVVTDVRMSGMTGIDLCRYISEDRPGIPVIVMTAYGDVNAALGALRAGAYEFVTKPLNGARLVELIERATADRNARACVNRLPPVNDGEMSDLAGSSNAAESLRQQLADVAQLDCSILLIGERGTGKRFLARLIHQLSPRRARPLVEADLRSLWFGNTLDDSLNRLEANDSQPVPFRYQLLSDAAGGTLLVNAIEATPEALRAEIVNLIEGVYPSQLDSKARTNARVIATAEQASLESVPVESFLYKLTRQTNVRTIFVPPLRQRDLDVISIANAILAKWAPNCGQFVLTAGAEHVLRSHDWPGNIEELEDCLKVAIASSGDQYIGAQHLPDVLSSSDCVPASQPVESLDQLERRHIEAVLSAHEGNKVLAARTLGIDRATLYRKLSRFPSMNNRNADPLRGNR